MITGTWWRNEKLWPVNNLAHSIIKQIDLHLNGTLISPQSDTYHYKAYLETLLNYDREDGKTVLGPQGWYNQVDFPPQWTDNNTNSAATACRTCSLGDLSANHKGALAAMVAETAKYAGGVTHSLVFTPHLEVFHYRQTVGARHRNQDEISFQWPEPVFEWGGSRRPIDGRRCQTTVSYLSTAFE